jgi:hypothetical protein
VQNPQDKIIDQATNTLIDKLLLEKIPLADIARVARRFRAPVPELHQSEIPERATSSGSTG